MVFYYIFYYNSAAIDNVSEKQRQIRDNNSW